MSLAPKIDEVREFVLRKEVDLVFITETWLKECMSDGVIDIPDFSVVRHDRKNGCMVACAHTLERDVVTNN